MPVPENMTDQALAEKEKGNAAYKAKDFPAAHQHYDKAFELDPTNIAFLTNKAAVYFEEAKFEDCIKTCEKAVEVGRENRADYTLIAKALARMGNAYLKKGEKKQALNFLDKSISEHRDPVIVQKRNQLDKEIKEEERLAYIDPALADKEKEKGNELFKAGKFPDAIKFYSEAIKRNPDDPKLYSNRAACYTKLMEFNMAVSDCDKCIEKDPKFVKAYIRKGHALLAMRDTPRAAKAFEDALELDPNAQEARDGFMRAQMGVRSEAPKDKEEAVKKAMEDPEVQQILGDPAMRMILEQMQQDPKALQEHLKNPDIMMKLQKLMNAGIVGVK
jgi:stress-induced-phosphoprotein 1